MIWHTQANLACADLLLVASCSTADRLDLVLMASGSLGAIISGELSCDIMQSTCCAGAVLRS